MLSTNLLISTRMPRIAILTAIPNKIITTELSVEEEMLQLNMGSCKKMLKGFKQLNPFRVNLIVSMM